MVSLSRPRFINLYLLIVAITQLGADAFEVDRLSGELSPYPVVKVNTSPRK